MTYFSIQLKAHLDKLNEKVDSKNKLTAYKIALEVGLDPTYVTNIFSGRRRGSADTLKKIASSQRLGVNYETLRSWQAQDQFEPEALQAASQLSPVPMPQAFDKIPCRGTVTAGGLELNSTAPDVVFYEWWDLGNISSSEKEALCCFKVQGDSMWPPVPNGSLLLVREVNSMKDKAWYVILTEYNESTFKMVEFDQKQARLVPLNPAYQPIAVEQFKIKAMYEVLKYQVNRI